ncbi:hypothetical protein PI124_g21782 [Phytophthora idaei]|nr:hypothetical protein PI125_g23527 [Phytophthora idaei]KAG3128219.1 hypothetical protein PI126_g21493 [Phytophthora idaei]KAG3233143.1 hypothetical protein PI124_g21782 [Phytophthora idaei]
MCQCLSTFVLEQKAAVDKDGPVALGKTARWEADVDDVTRAVNWGAICPFTIGKNPCAISSVPSGSPRHQHL